MDSYGGGQTRGCYNCESAPDSRFHSTRQRHASILSAETNPSLQLHHSSCAMFRRAIFLGTNQYTGYNWRWQLNE
ncbi:hypothetical protein B0O99DRAFT_619953 [Bisporella sp. PMI_857]|nr:hypothetical protein B0O99DRAFT_619953 [Bisporella sp. PMI_857]